MNKLLLTDIDGTLFSAIADCDKELPIVKEMLNEWLAKDNFLSVITDSSHSNPQEMHFVLSKINSAINEKYRGNVLYFITNTMYQVWNNKEREEKTIRFLQTDGDRFPFEQVTYRTECLNKSVQIFGKSKTIFSIGDTEADIYLAIKAIEEFNAYCGLIYSQERKSWYEAIDCDIYSIKERELLLRSAIMIYWNDNPEDRQITLSESSEVNINDQILKFFDYVSKQYRQGFITLDDLQLFAYLGQNSFTKDISVILNSKDGQNDNMPHYGLYPDFESFFARALKK